MIIKKLKIKNYRNFRDFEIDLKPFTLIIGENNIGKTNLLNAIGLIFSQEITFFKKRMLEVDDINYESVQEFKKEILTDKPANEIEAPIVRIEAELSDFTPQQKAAVADWFVDDNLETARLTYKFFPKVDLTKWIEEKRVSINACTQDANESDEDFTKRKLNFIEFPIFNYSFVILGGLDESKQADYYFLKALKFEFLDALRDAKTQLVASGDYRLLYKVLLNRGSNNYDIIKQTLAQLKKDVDNNAELTAVKAEIKTFLDKTSLVEEDNHNAVDLLFSKPDENEMLKKLSLQYGNSPVTVERNGTGRNNLLYISLLLSHLIYKNIPEILFRLIAIEEPESHLHPHLQEHLSKNIQSEVSDERQIIVTSHCPHITSKLELENTVILYKNTEGIQNCYFIDRFKDDNGNLNAAAKKSIRYLQRYLDATKSTMFFGRKIILVEGIAEQILVPKLFEIHTGKCLEKVGCTLVNVNGVGFRHFLEIIRRGFFLKCLALTDSDSDTKAKDRAENLSNDYAGCAEIKVSITDESTFEKDLIEANNTNDSKKYILDAVRLTRPNSGLAFSDAHQNILLNIDECFKLIESVNANGAKTSYKAEFAMDLLSVLEGENKNFVVPQYIKDGFDFIA